MREEGLGWAEDADAGGVRRIKRLGIRLLVWMPLLVQDGGWVGIVLGATLVWELLGLGMRRAGGVWRRVRVGVVLVEGGEGI